MKKIITFIALTFTLVSYSQFDSSNLTKLDILFNKLRHIKYADFNKGENSLKYLIARGANENADISAFSQFVLENLKLEGAIFTEEQRKQALTNCKSISEIVDLTWRIGAFESDFGAIGKYPCTVYFSFADGTMYEFNCPINVSGLTMSLPKAILRSLKKNIYSTNGGGNDYQIKIPLGEILYTENELNTLLDNKKDKNVVEGIYKIFSGTASMSKIGIIKKDDKFYILNIENNYFKDDWKNGEIKGVLTPTMSSKMFTGTLKNVMKKDDKITLVVTEDNTIEIHSAENARHNYTFVKIK